MLGFDLKQVGLKKGQMMCFLLHFHDSMPATTGIFHISSKKHNIPSLVCMRAFVLGAKGGCLKHTAVAVAHSQIVERQLCAITNGTRHMGYVPAMRRTFEIEIITTIH